MATITLSNVPDELYAALRKRAAQNHREVADEIVAIAQETLIERWGTLSVEEQLKVIDKARENSPGAWITDEMIREARDEGRP